jgi:antitoxin PrlF
MYMQLIKGTADMTEILATMTKRGQITVPAEVRRLLGIKPRDRVAFSIEDSEVRLRPARFTLESVFGSVEPATSTADFKTISREAREGRVEQQVRQLKE